MKKYNFCDRHIGPRESDVNLILDTIGASSIKELIDQTIPAHIQLKSEMNLPKPLTEDRFIEHMKSLGAKNKTYRSTLVWVIIILFCLV